MGELLGYRALYSRQKKRCLSTLCKYGCRLLAVTLTKLVDLLGSLQNVLLAGVERMRLARDFQLQQRVLVSVFPLDGFSGGYGGLRQDGKLG